VETTKPTVGQSAGASPAPIPTSNRIASAIGIVIPFVGLIVALIGLWGWGVTATELILMAVMYLLTGLGITMGYHRLFTHKSFETVRPIKALLAILGSMSVQGPVLRWVATHRRHHQHSDTADDPHSPNCHGGGVWGVISGFWRAHVGWIFEKDHPGLSNYVRDLHADRLVVAVSKLFPLWVVLSLLIPAGVGGLVAGTWTGVWLGFLWGGLVRIFLVHHVTWSINSACHLWGSQPYDCQDGSRNNFLFGIFGLGEGWHNNHHMFPTSARHGLKWWQIDVSYITIRFLERIGLAWRVRVPSSEQLNPGS
jgi:stearoyl-CoA desaturase (delta-9 desaturase)